ncbi:hypothetical protein [Desulfosarcina sp.]|uniref:hypothetical protein n=1 Tax=Desulfosarcina sp. TaxID=2027861 RepID=UPI00356654C4
MTVREKIIVSIMAATVLLGGYLYWWPVTIDSRRVVQNQSDGQALEFARNVNQKFKEDTALNMDLFIIRSAERNWEKDPFLKKGTLLSDTPQRDAAVAASPNAGIQPNLAYTGYLEVGTQRLAIINGIEYTSGEAVDGKGHYVRRIHPHQVEIGNQHTPGVIILKLIEYEAITGK